MNEFKEEFSQLLRRYASKETTANTKLPEMPTPLSSQQILDAIRETLRLTLDINLQNIEADANFKTPVNEIVITTPDAPDVLRMDYNQNGALPDRYKPLESVTTVDDFLESSKSWLSAHKKPDNETASADKSSLEQRDTLATELENSEQKIKRELPKLDLSKNLFMYNKVEDAHKNAMKVAHQLEDLKEILMPETRPVRRLSAIMSLPLLKHQQHQQQHHQSAASCSSQRTAQRVKALRRSIHQLNEDVPVTPTSSRLSLAPPPAAVLSSSVAKKTSGGGGIASKPASKLTLGQHNRSVSTLALTESNKSAAGTLTAAATSKSPSKSSSSLLPVKNSKYAHVQSTIPKPMHLAVKRKVQ